MPRKSSADSDGSPPNDLTRANSTVLASPFVRLSQIDASDTRFQFRICSAADDLVSSISSEGLHTPVVLLGNSVPYRIIDGFRRIEAVTRLGWYEVRAIIERNISENQAAVAAFSANVRRRNLSALDRASVIWFAIHRWKMRKQEIGESFGLSDRQIERYINCLDFDKALLIAIKENRIAMAHALLLHHARASNIDKWVERIASSKLSVSDLKRELSGSRRHRNCRYLIRDSRGFRLRPIRYREGATTMEKQMIATALQDAIEIVVGKQTVTRSTQ
jgi:ParB/RepB/Spo0J family partition protein